MRCALAWGHEAIGRKARALKGVLLTGINLGGIDVDIYETHMAAGGRPETEPARVPQAIDIAAFAPLRLR